MREFGIRYGGYRRMGQLDNNQRAFLELLRGGLWAEPVYGSRFSINGSVGWEEVYKLAEEQSVVGLVAAGIDNLNANDNANLNVSLEWKLQFVGATLQIENRNKEMNKFLSSLIGRLRAENIYTLVVKGQGIAQCYERPLLRSAGDIDLLMDSDNYQKAKKFLKKYGVYDEEDSDRMHLAMNIDSWAVELHGTLRSGLWKGLDKKLDELQDETLRENKIRVWRNDDIEVLLPAIDIDVLFVFAHILQHYYQEGIGLRQICDWCRLLWTYRESLNHGQLESRIKEAALMTEWKAFAALAVDFLGMPEDAMPFYGSSYKWRRKAEKIMVFVMETGNFGHNRDYSYYDNHSVLGYKMISLWRHTKDFFRYICVFPVDSIKVYWSMIVRGAKVAAQGK